jgi:hypothetical protein
MLDFFCTYATKPGMVVVAVPLDGLDWIKINVLRGLLQIKIWHKSYASSEWKANLVA